MVVSIGVIGLILPVLFSIIFVIFQEQTKVYRLSHVKQEGDHVINVMDYLIRNYAAGIYTDSSATNEVCAAPGSSQTSGNLYFKDLNDNTFEFFLINNAGQYTIASDSFRPAGSASPETTDLTSSAVSIDNTTFSIICNKTSDFSPPVVTVQYKVSYQTSSTRPEDKAELSYQTSIKLNNY